jgi:two-component system alkaline phosphatase synthesis response regulator PhoP
MDVQKILVCDDEANIRNIMDFSLEAEGFLVVSADDGDTALQAAISEEPDLIILDVMMPGADGLSVCRELKQNPRTRHIPVLMLTARAARSDREAGLAAGADEYVTKPFSPQRLVQKVNELLGVRG